MTIQAITFLPPISMPSVASMDAVELSAGSGAAASSALSAPSGQFASWFSQQLTQVNEQLTTADLGVQQLAAGDATNLHQVMINLEQAKLSMQLVMQVRNHLLDAYHELLQMQV